MPIARACSFCGNDIEPGTGKMYVRKDATVFLFCSSKCERNLVDLGRVPRTIPWTRAAIQAKARAKGLAVEEARGELAVVEDEVAASSEFAIALPKGKDIPQAIHDLIERRLGPGLSSSEIESRFRDFCKSEDLRDSLATWYGKKHGKKKLTAVDVEEFTSFLETGPAKKLLKDWLDAEAKKERAAAREA